ncbi:MAG: CDGSH iron-sulfur domain-containing protein [Pirellulaceae bacterium]
MSNVRIRIRDHGPLVIEGPIELVDAQGDALELPTGKPVLALCRCGHSSNKPFCDGAHRAAGFDSACRAVPSPSAPPS